MTEEHVTESIAVAIGRMDERLKSMDRKVDTMNTTILDAARGTTSLIADHEQRIRTLERLIWQVAAASAIMGGIIGFFSPFIHLEIGMRP